MENRDIFCHAILQAHKNNPKLIPEGLADFCMDDKFEDGYYRIIFSHRFVEAFFGKKEYEDMVLVHDELKNDSNDYTFKEFKLKFGEFLFKQLNEIDPYYLTDRTSVIHNRVNACYIFSIVNRLINKGWEYHIQQMTLEKEPLKYLEKFLETDNV